MDRSLLSNGTQSSAEQWLRINQNAIFLSRSFSGPPARSRHGYLVFRPCRVTNSPLLTSNQITTLYLRRLDQIHVVAAVPQVVLAPAECSGLEPYSRETKFRVFFPLKHFFVFSEWTQEKRFFLRSFLTHYLLIISNTIFFYRNSQ